jgi:hypothetical protein
MAIEEHGSDRQLIRLRVRPKISFLAWSITLVFGLLASLAAADHAPAGAVILGLAALYLGLHSLIDCASAAAACHKTVCGIIEATKSEGPDKLADGNDPGLFIAQSDSISDLEDVKRGSDSSSLPQKPVHESESIQQ